MAGSSSGSEEGNTKPNLISLRQAPISCNDYSWLITKNKFRNGKNSLIYQYTVNKGLFYSRPEVIQHDYNADGTLDETIVCVDRLIWIREYGNHKPKFIPCEETNCKTINIPESTTVYKLIKQRSNGAFSSVKSKSPTCGKDFKKQYDALSNKIRLIMDKYRRPVTYM